MSLISRAASLLPGLPAVTRDRTHTGKQRRASNNKPAHYRMVCCLLGARKTGVNLRRGSWLVELANRFALAVPDPPSPTAGRA